MRDTLIKLTTKYPNGSRLDKKTTEIWATKKSLTRNEYYSAYGVGLTARHILDVMPSEFDEASVVVGGILYQPTEVIVDGVTMNIIRTFEKNSASMELTVG